MLKDREGNRIYRRVEVKVIPPKDVMAASTKVFRAPAGKGFNQDNIDTIINDIVDHLEGLFPFWEFELVPLKPENRRIKYVLKHKGYRNVTPVLPPSSAPDAAQPTEVAQP